MEQEQDDQSPDNNEEVSQTFKNENNPDHENSQHLSEENSDEELEMTEYQNDKLSPGRQVLSPEVLKPSNSRIVSNFKIRRKMQTVITDFYDSFDRLFPK